MKKKYNMYEFEVKYRVKGYKHIAGLDEAGRGPWAGPLVVAAVILPLDYRNDKINDSKQLSTNIRNELFIEIKKIALDYSIIFIDPAEVDKIGPKYASIEGMKHALNELKIKPDIALVDAEQLNTKTEAQSIIKGDEKSISIAAASILAKVARDYYMIKIDAKYPGYNFKKHKGYGTAEHLNALRKHGPIKGFHRYSYRPIKKVINDQKSK